MFSRGLLERQTLAEGLLCRIYLTAQQSFYIELLMDYFPDVDLAQPNVTSDILKEVPNRGTLLLNAGF